MLGHGSGFDSPGWREIRRVTPLLGQAFHALREQAGLSLADVYVHGRDHEELYQLAEALIEWDERINFWRIRHYKVVARVIGDSVVGTQGTPVEVLGRLVHHVFFPELWRVRNELTALSQEQCSERAGRRGGARARTSGSPSGSHRVHDELVDVLAPRQGEQWLDAATGTGEVALRAARAGAERHRLRLRAGLMLEKARRTASDGLEVRPRPGGRRRRFRTRTPRSTSSPRPSASSSRPIAIGSPPSSAASSPARRTARPHWPWLPDEEVDEASGAVHPAASRSRSTPGATRPRCSELLGDDFELEIECRTWWLTGPDGLGRLGSSSRPPRRRFECCSRRSAMSSAEELRDAFVELYERHREGDEMRPHHGTTSSCSARGADGDAALRDEAVGLLQQLLRLNTVNPPGNETLAAELLRDYLVANGVEVELYSRTPGAGEPRRAAAGRRRAEPLLPLAHRHRRRRPGRMVARPVVRRPGRRPRLGPRRARHEEPGRGERRRDRLARPRGLQAARRPRLRRRRRRGGRRELRPRSGSATSIRTPCGSTTRSTRAAASGSSSAAAPFYLCATAEKMSAPFRITVHGRSGHASMPGIADNALVKAAPLIEKLAAYRPEPSIGPEVAGFLDAVLGEQPRAARGARRGSPPSTRSRSRRSSRCSRSRSRRR